MFGVSCFGVRPTSIVSTLFRTTGDAQKSQVMVEVMKYDSIIKDPNVSEAVRDGASENKKYLLKLFEESHISKKKAAATKPEKPAADPKSEPTTADSDEMDAQMLASVVGG